MKITRKGIFIVILLLVAAFIKWFSSNAGRVEVGYATKVYVFLSQLLRTVLGWLPISVGDILYGLTVIWLAAKLVKICRLFYQKKVRLKATFSKLGNSILIALCLYVIFNGFWGINYNRLGITHQLQLKIDTVSYDDLKQTTHLLINKMNATKQYLVANKVAYPNNRRLFKQTAIAYQNASKKYPYLKYNSVSLKSSLWGWLGNYAGFSGYYNPFTGEAQVNTTIPKFLQPFVACHEVAHQLGYAKENEANSVAFVTALQSNDSLLLYSTYFDMYNYTSRQLYLQAFIKKDTAIFTYYKQSLSPAVLADVKEMIAFNKSHRNPIEPLVRSGYNFYLKNNNQPLGLLTYDAVTSFIVAYYKKYGML
jgi:hypothetical protein